MWSNNDLPHGLHKTLNDDYYNLLHLHWIGTGLLPISSFPLLKKPIVWTLHDMWAFTGGCHITQGCTRYETHCGKCPQLNSNIEQDLSYRNFERKLKHWRDVPMTIIAPSHWLANCARDSVLLADKTIEVIPNPVNTASFKPLNKICARQALSLPIDKRLILFGAGDVSDINKGRDLLIAALVQLTNQPDSELVLFGGGETKELTLPMPHHMIGSISDTRLLAQLYDAADVVVVPSRQENLNNIVMEALACGTPCVTFNIGGMPDMIDHQQNGYLAEPYSVDDLARGIQWVLSEADTAALSHHAREKILAGFSMEVVAKQYISVYERVLGISS
jgi:glycosyltransferase involved in cell wall biosynthesis